MKKLFAVLLTLTLVLSMVTIALAAETGTIIIDNAFEGAVYNIYKILDFEPVAGSTTQGRYTVADGWADLITGAGAEYLKENKDVGTIEWYGENIPSRTAALAKAAIAYAEANNIEPTATQTAGTNGKVEFTNVDLGYYAIDTSLGTACGLTNVDSVFEAHEKNAKPDIDKYVREDSEVNNQDGGWGKVNDADIDQVVEFKSTITTGIGVLNYIMHDTMEAGLTFDPDSVTVKRANGDIVAADNYEVVYPATDGHTFDIIFKDSFIETLAMNDTITVYYSATLNEDANIVVDGNDNTVYLSYGEKSEWKTNEHTTSTYTWKVDVLKFTMEAGQKVSLAGAEFQLLANDDSVIKFVEVEGAEVPTYMVAKDGDIDTIITDEEGKFEIVGLDEGIYKLHESKAPEGYNLLAVDKVITIQSKYNDATLEAEYDINSQDPATIEVENKTGVVLPETGGIGTTIFYIVGSLLMAAAFVLLISKKRMANFA